MLMYVCQPLQDLMAPASDAGFRHQLGSVLHQLIQIAILQINIGLIVSANDGHKCMELWSGHREGCLCSIMKRTSGALYVIELGQIVL